MDNPSRHSLRTFAPVLPRCNPSSLYWSICSQSSAESVQCVTALIYFHPRPHPLSLHYFSNNIFIQYTNELFLSNNLLTPYFQIVGLHYFFELIFLIMICTVTYNCSPFPSMMSCSNSRHPSYQGGSMLTWSLNYDCRNAKPFIMKSLITNTSPHIFLPPYTANGAMNNFAAAATFLKEDISPSSIQRGISIGKGNGYRFMQHLPSSILPGSYPLPFYMTEWVILIHLCFTVNPPAVPAPGPYCD